MLWSVWREILSAMTDGQRQLEDETSTNVIEPSQYAAGVAV
jgi:hypothetical protein